MRCWLKKKKKEQQTTEKIPTQKGKTCFWVEMVLDPWILPGRRGRTGWGGQFGQKFPQTRHRWLWRGRGHWCGGSGGPPTPPRMHPTHPRGRFKHLGDGPLFPGAAQLACSEWETQPPARPAGRHSARAAGSPLVGCPAVHEEDAPSPGSKLTPAP